LYKVTGKQQHRETALRAAEVLAHRFDPKGGYIRAWGRLDESDTNYAGLAIIDCMMNLPLLYWASAESGDDYFLGVAVRHADTTLKYFVRADDSVFHSFRWDPATGTPRGGDNFCGYSIDSQWARGTAWAIFGFALSYRYTQEAKHLEAALRLARRFSKLLDNEVVPVWDFRLPPGTKGIRDSSAAAIAACAFQELVKFCGEQKMFAETTKALLNRLCSRDYLDSSDSCPGVLKFGEVGDGGKARTAYTSWGDYFFMEALARFLGKGESYW
jgi:unsaturated chondroitin disaccharide hydrolase